MTAFAAVTEYLRRWNHVGNHRGEPGHPFLYRAPQPAFYGVFDHEPAERDISDYERHDFDDVASEQPEGEEEWRQ